jgi:hypothetical protein
MERKQALPGSLIFLKQVRNIYERQKPYYDANHGGY